MTRRLLILLPVLALLLLAGCGDDEGGGDNSSDLTARAVKSAQGAESYRLRMKLDSDLGGEKIFLEGEGVSAADQSRGRFDMKMAFGDEEPQDVEMINADGQMYMRGGVFEELTKGDEKWVRVPDETPSTMTPSEFIEFLDGAGEVEEVGTEDVNGKPAVHIRGPLDMKELIEKTDSAAAKRFSKMPGYEEIEAEIDVWIDEAEETISRMALEMRHPDAEGAMKVSADILEYDVSLKGIEAPPAGQVVDGSALGG